MKREGVVPGEYYHIFNRGNNRQIIFNDTRDYIRFLFLILYCQSSEKFYEIPKQVLHYLANRKFDIDKDRLSKIIDSKYIELSCFCFMPNHFHLLVRCKEEYGFSKLLQRVQIAYTKYYNLKYDTVGHLFQGAYKIKRVESNAQLLYLSAYIHMNPRELSQWKNKEVAYPWSSYQDYVSKNRWAYILETEKILNQFNSAQEYAEYVNLSGAKQIN